MSTVVIVDYGVGNLLSVARAFRHVGADVSISGNPKEIARADRIVLPGVGAFGDCMRALREQGLDVAVKEYAASGRPILGICVGMQVMMDESEEFGLHAGLGLIPGRVVAIPSTNIQGERHKIPHIGWTPVNIPAGAGTDPWAGTVFANIPDGSHFYFVHSFTAAPTNPQFRLADSFYNGRLLAAAIKRDNVTGVQFHPEKSGEYGLLLIRRFLEC